MKTHIKLVSMQNDDDFDAEVERILFLIENNGAMLKDIKFNSHGLPNGNDVFNALIIYNVMDNYKDPLTS